MKDLQHSIRELKDELLEAMERLEQMDIGYDEFTPSKRLDLNPLPNIDPERCPKCGKPGSLQTKVVPAGKKIYRYPAFAHYVGMEGTTTKIRWCYLKRSKKK